MRLLFVADGRSPIALNWVEYFVQRGYEAHLVSTFACSPNLKLSSLQVIPVAFSRGARMRGAGAVRAARFLRTRALVRHWLGPWTVPAAGRSLRAVIHRVRPDVIHAMRIPFEGMMAAFAEPDVPLLQSTWGNDFTLHAPASPAMGRHTRAALRRADGLHVDCRRDTRLAFDWGYPKGRQVWVLPGNGGVRRNVFGPEGKPPVWLEGLPAGVPVIVNPRGFRTYVRTDTFFQSLPKVLQQHPLAVIACPAMAGEPQAEAWVRRLGLGRSVRLLPQLDAAGMAAVFRRATVVVSPSQHDGTPNSLLEAMACGSFPIAGDIESLREWLTPGVNGLLIDPSSAQALAAAIGQALDDPDLRARAAEVNTRLIAERADFDRVMPRVESIYTELAAGRRFESDAML